MTLNRKARRAQAKQKHKPIRQFAEFLTQVDGCEITAWQQHDLNWFREHPECTYHLREIFPGEYEPEEVPPPHAWLSLVKSGVSMTLVAADTLTVPLIQQCPIAPEPANGLNCLMAKQTLTKGQEALRAIWDDYKQQVEGE